jgi:hypothetical protein
MDRIALIRNQHKMKWIVLNMVVVFLCLAHQGHCGLNVYLIYYATVNGETGHSGIALDNYNIVSVEKEKKGLVVSSYDTVKTGALTYYDLWPKEDYFDKKLIRSDKVATYYKLPRATWEPEITVHSLMSKGIPHKEGYPVDGLIQITTAPYQDKLVRIFLDSLITSDKPFNAIQYNCSDFVEQAVEYLIKKDISAKEFILYGFSTTPNKLFKKTAELKGCKVIKDPGKLTNGIFLIERVLKREIIKTNS